MQWRVLRELDELIKEEPTRWKIDLESVTRYKERMLKKEQYRKTIHNYLRKYNKPIGMLSREDIVIMTEGLNAMDKSLFMDQVKHCLETTWWKPIKRIIQNNKSILFSKQ